MSDFEKLEHYKAKMEFYGGKLGLEDLEGGVDKLVTEDQIKSLEEDLTLVKNAITKSTLLNKIEALRTSLKPSLLTRMTTPKPKV